MSTEMVKIFSGSLPEKLEKKVNKWLGSQAEAIDVTHRLLAVGDGRIVLTLAYQPGETETPDD